MASPVTNSIPFSPYGIKGESDSFIMPKKFEISPELVDKLSHAETEEAALECVPLLHLQETIIQAPISDAVIHLWHIIHQPDEANISDALDMLTHSAELEALGKTSTDFERFQFQATKTEGKLVFNVEIKGSPVEKQLTVNPMPTELTEIAEQPISNKSEFFTGNAPLHSKKLLEDVSLSLSNDGKLELKGKYLNPSQHARLLGEISNLTPNQQKIFMANKNQELQKWITFNSNLWAHVADKSEQFIKDAGHLLEVAPPESASAMEQTLQVIGLIRDISNVQDLYQQRMLGEMITQSFSRPRLSSQVSWG
ncbi:hypothetical protein SOPP22_18165 [Shewanella sp. OPT22]|nr:hypothetical protein SOPP22_18165 [Shewanella sp. OPT22]